MKVCKFIYSLITLTCLINITESGNKKLQKSFDEIFGEGWEKKGQKSDANLEDGLGGDQRDGIGKCLSKVLQLRKINYLEQINDELTDQNDSEHEKCDPSESDQQKREIICKFYAIKEKMKEKGIKFSAKERNKIEGIIAKKLSTNRTTIYKWRREFGWGKRNKKNYFKKLVIIQKFMTMCSEYKEIRKHSRKEWAQKYAKISKKLGVSRLTIQRWKKEFGICIKNKNYEIYSKNQKFEIVQKFMARCNEYKEIRKYSRKEWKQNYAEISKQLGVCYDSIQKWKKAFKMCRKIYSSEEKLEIMKKFWEMKRNTPKMSDREIAKILKIDEMNIRRWKGEFREERNSTDYHIA